MAFTLPAVPPGNLKYCRPSNIITDQLTWSVEAGTISTNPDYQLPALYDEKMARPLKFIDEPPIAVRIVGDAGIGNTVRVDGMALPNSNLPQGTVMRAEMNATNVWTAPSLSVNVTIGAPGKDRHVASPWADFVAASGYSVLGYRFVSFFVPATAVQPWLGELLVMRELEEFSVWPQFGSRGASHPFLENIYTEFGQRRVVKRLIRQRRVTYPFKGNAADFDRLQAIAEDCGGVAEPFFLVADSNVKTDGGLYGRLTPETAALIENAEEWFDLENFTIAFEEDSRSLPF